MDRQVLPQLPQSRRTIATYTNYADAQRAVDFLSDQNFPVQRTAIVAEGLKLVEQVTGRLNYGRALLSGALSGGSTGFLVGLIFSVFSAVPSLLTFALYGLIAGAVIGALISLASYALSGGRRDFASVSGMQAERYNIMVDEEVANDAALLLRQLR